MRSRNLVAMERIKVGMERGNCFWSVGKTCPLATIEVLCMCVINISTDVRREENLR